MDAALGDHGNKMVLNQLLEISSNKQCICYQSVILISLQNVSALFICI